MGKRITVFGQKKRKIQLDCAQTEGLGKSLLMINLKFLFGGVERGCFPLRPCVLILKD